MVAGVLLRVALGPILDLPALARENYRGRTVATAAGVVLPAALLLVEGGRAVAVAFGTGHALDQSGAMVLVAALAFGFLGLVDDVVGLGQARGFRGHLAEAARGRLTTGGLKLLGGAAAGLVLAAALDGDSPGRVFADAALIALGANLANQLDRRPGRLLKVGVAAFVVLSASTRAWRSMEGVAVVVGAAAALVFDDLRERLMLGDVGANALGACLAVGVVVSSSFGVRLAVLAGVAALNVVGELSSFTRLIDAVPPLRTLDRAGRRDP